MGSKSPRMTFAAIGHQDCWEKILSFTNFLRKEDHNVALTLDKVKGVYSFFPPTKLFDVYATSPASGLVEGSYVESFISPDELDGKYLWKNVAKVKKACEKASNLGASVVSLGGFTSIVLEASGSSISRINGTAFTTGNTLTAAFIADSLERASEKWNKPLRNCKLMVIGSTGDIGSACVNYFADKVRELLLIARQPSVLEMQAVKMRESNAACRSSVDAITLLPEADMVICVASDQMPLHYLQLLPKNAIVCDAGYPKSFLTATGRDDLKIYAGGMGVIQSGFNFTPAPYHELIYDFPQSNISHGCLLESIVLAMENRAEAYSVGRGNITKDRMSEILNLAARHGVVTAPFFNSSSLLY